MAKVLAGNESARLMARARTLMPGGVSSPVRAFNNVGGEPFVVDRGEKAVLYDVDGRAYIDYVMSWGALMLGHAHPAIVNAVAEAAERGTSYGATASGEIQLAELIVHAVPSVEMVRFVNSGTEATMSAVRLARAVTGRDVILKFAGCYHGHGDAFLSEAGSGVATLGLPATPGVPAAVAEQTLTVPYNDLDAATSAFDDAGERIACVIVEPIGGNAGFIPPGEGFLEGLRAVTAEHGALLIFDEVMTGFRVGPAGAQGLFGVTPDLSTFGKVIGGGLPVGAYGGRRELMERVAPAGAVYQAGTLSGNPLAMAAGIAQLLALRESGPYGVLERRARRLVDGVVDAAARHAVPAWGGAHGAMFGWFFTEGPVRNIDDARRVDADLFARVFHGCLRRGVFLPPSPFEAAFLSTAHDDADVDRTIDVLDEAIAEALGADQMLDG
ncbi:MAG: glutamate-1-semialdehyde 2,1-aminomutase [Longimicrobiales bacterium]